MQCILRAGEGGGGRGGRGRGGGGGGGRFCAGRQFDRRLLSGQADLTSEKSKG